MDYREYRLSTDDGLQLHARRWLPGSEPVAVVALVHGLSEHSGRYQTFGEELSGQGFAVYAADLRGHGLSEGPRIFVRSFDIFVADVIHWLEQIRIEQPGRPLFLFGHSMGGLIVAWLAVRCCRETGAGFRILPAELPPYTAGRAPVSVIEDGRDLDIRGLIFSAAALRVSDEVAPTLRRIAGAASLLLPTLRVVKIRSKKLSRDPQVVARFESDPLVYHGCMPNRTAGEILGAARRIQKHFQAIRLPFLAMHGTSDVVTDPQGSRQLYQQAVSSDKTLKLYDGLYHDLLHEPERGQIVADVAQWLHGRCHGG